MIKTVRILYNFFLKPSGEVAIGGVQSYIRSLFEVLSEMGLKDIVFYQSSKTPFNTIREGIRICGTGSGKKGYQIINYIQRHETPDFENDLVIFATDFLACKSKFKKTIAIQHGIAFDGTSDSPVSDFKNYTCIFKNSLRSILKYNRFKYCSCVVCVDYNFLNWYKTQVNYLGPNFYVIPNFSKLGENNAKRHVDDTISIIFARRLEIYRGTRLFSEAILPLLKQYNNIRVTIAGNGSDEEWIKSQFKPFNNVQFTTYSAENSLSFHSQYDIAVVPSKCSEGTSLSLLEAMAAGCAVVCTNVGGMTNIVLDGCNGLMVRPDARELSVAIERLILDEKYRQLLARNAQKTIKASFSFDKWKNSWIKIIEMFE